MRPDPAREGALDVALDGDCHRLVLSRLLDDAEWCALAACEPAELRLVVEEVLTNVVKYSGAAEAGASARVRWRMWPDRLELSFEDPGKAFDPLGFQEQDGVDGDRSDGGMGILLVQSIAGSVAYHRTDGRNRLELTFGEAA